MEDKSTEGAVKAEPRMCTCQKSKCGRSWPTRLPAPRVPKECPYCKRTDWQEPDSILPKLQCVCTHCDWHWESDLPQGPKYCPGCGTTAWREKRDRVDNICLICQYWVDGKCLRRFHKPVANKCKGWDPIVNALPEIGEAICLSCLGNVWKEGKCSRGCHKPLENKCRNYLGGLPNAVALPAGF